MEKIKTQEVYVPVESVTELRLQYRKSNVLIDPALKFVEKHTDKYLLSKEEIIKLVGDGFNNGMAYGHADGADILKYTNHPDKQTYIDNLFK